MKIHKLIQGTPDWLAFKADRFGSSEAAPMLGLSPNTSRTELLKLKKFGLSKEFSEWVQKYILDKGHMVEALARPIIEVQFGIDLYPVVCSEGKLSVSCDGSTLDGKIVWEHKQFAEALFEMVRTGRVPDEHMPQCQQLLMVTGADVLYFTVSDGTADRMSTVSVFPDQKWFERLRSGWAQFERDLAEFVPVQIDEKPEGKAVIELPALFLQAEGRLVNSNMEAFGTALKLHLEETRKQVYVTDQDFADADKRAKMYRETCDKLTLTKQSMLSQTVSIDEAFRMIDLWHEDLRTTALQIEKDVKKNKEAKQINIINEGKIGFTSFIAELEKGIAPIRLIYTAPNFAEAIKGKRLFSVMHDEVQTMLANAKVEYSNVALGINANMNWLKQHDEYRFLFNDLQTIAYKAADDFQMLVNSRIAEHKRVEAEKIEAARQAAITEERARAEAAAAIEAAKVKEAEEQRQRAEAAKLLAEKIEQTPIKAHDDYLEPSSMLLKSAIGIQIQPPASIARIDTMPVPDRLPENPASPPTLRLGQIVERLGFTVTSEFLASLGFAPSAKERSAMLYHERDFLRICEAISEHIHDVYQMHKQAA